MTEPLWIDVPQLRRLGEQVRTCGDDVRKDLSQVRADLATAEGAGTSGWAAHTALRDAAEGWRTFLDGYATRVGEAGSQVIAAADDYATADRRGAARVGGRRYE